MSWGEPYNHWCMDILKIRVVSAYLRNITKKYDVIEYIGIAADEKGRIKEKCCPLVEWKITEKVCLEYCYAKGIDLMSVLKKRKT